VELEAINAIAQLIAAVGVIASLFYLAAHIRQNTRSMRAVVVDSLAHSLVDLLGPQVQNPGSLCAFSVVTENWDAASEEAVHVRCRSSSRHLSFSKTHGSSNARALWIRNNGKVGMLIFASTMIGLE
jgi:hypothetical protein